MLDHMYGASFFFAGSGSSTESMLRFTEEFPLVGEEGALVESDTDVSSRLQRHFCVVPFELLVFELFYIARVDPG